MLSSVGLLTAALALLTPLTTAYTQPTGDSPSGNPIYTPGLNQIVPVGQPFQITWDPTTPQDTVTLVLLKGPSTNAVPQYPIIENLPNTGTFTWIPSVELADSAGPTGYGIQLIDDATGAYQYSTQFGISNPAVPSGSPTTISAPVSSSAAAYTSSFASAYLPASATVYSGSYSASFSASSSSAWPSISAGPYPSGVYSQPASGGWLPSGIYSHSANYPLVYPSGWLPGNGTGSAHKTGGVYSASRTLKPTGTGEPVALASVGAGVVNRGTVGKGLVVAGAMAMWAL